MEFTWPILVAGLLLGILQLAVGVVLGRTLSLSRGRSKRPQPPDVGLLSEFASGLQGLATTVANDVGNHQVQMERMSKDLASRQQGNGSQVTGPVLKTVTQIIQVNERLQNRLSAAEERLQRQAEQIKSHVTEARTDPLTGLPNRRAFDDELLRRIAEWQRTRAIFCLMMIDIDHFKRLNDRYGHPAGDCVLRELADVLKHTLREMDLVARVGGEEFAAILPSTNSTDAAQAVNRIRSAVDSKRVRFEQSELRLTVSLGLAVVAEGDDSVSVVKRADEALYASKHSGRNCGHLHDGGRCELIHPAEPASEASSSRPAAESDHAGVADSPEETDLGEICDDVRTRLSELVRKQ